MQISTCGRRSGFTLIELLVVITVIALLIALLFPAIGAAVRAARNASVTSEINMMAQALADYKSKYSAYPPSRILLSEQGTYVLDRTTTSYATGAGTVDLTDGQLAQRSVTWLRKIWPRLAIAVGTVSSPPVPPAIPGPLGFYDWNNNGKIDPAYVLSGDECLVFFLGGIPSIVTPPGGRPTYGMNGFCRNPVNPSLAPTVVVGTNTFSFVSRLGPLLEFKPGRLVDLDNDGMPSYQDPLGTEKSYAYFSSYGVGQYDPNDVNFPAEAGESGSAPISLKFNVGSPVGSGTFATSASPNPYTVSATDATTIAYHAPNTYQIISSGYDGLFGIGGQYAPGAPQPLPIDTANTLPTGSSQQLRVREADNLSNISTGKLD